MTARYAVNGDFTLFSFRRAILMFISINKHDGSELAFNVRIGYHFIRSSADYMQAPFGTHNTEEMKRNERKKPHRCNRNAIEVQF
jgi:hypothetical protein